MAIISSLLWNHAPSYSAWNCVYQLESSFSVSLHPSLDVCVESQLKRYSTSHSVSWSWVARSLRRSISIEFPLSSSCRMKISKAKTSTLIEATDQHIREEQLDHEDRVSFVSPLSSYLTSWISGRDSCLVGVSCHSPRSALVWLLLVPHVIMFNFQRNLKWGCWNPSTKCIQLGSSKQYFQWTQMPFRKVHDFC